MVPTSDVKGRLPFDIPHGAHDCIPPRFQKLTKMIQNGRTVAAASGVGAGCVAIRLQPKTCCCTKRGTLERRGRASRDASSHFLVRHSVTVFGRLIQEIDTPTGVCRRSRHNVLHLPLPAAKRKLRPSVSKATFELLQTLSVDVPIHITLVPRNYPCPSRVPAAARRAAAVCQGDAS